MIHNHLHPDSQCQAHWAVSHNGFLRPTVLLQVHDYFGEEARIMLAPETTRYLVMRLRALADAVEGRGLELDVDGLLAPTDPSLLEDVLADPPGEIVEHWAACATAKARGVQLRLKDRHGVAARILLSPEVARIMSDMLLGSIPRAEKDYHDNAEVRHLMAQARARDEGTLLLTASGAEDSV